MPGAGSRKQVSFGRRSCGLAPEGHHAPNRPPAAGAKLDRKSHRDRRHAMVLQPPREKVDAENHDLDAGLVPGCVPRSSEIVAAPSGAAPASVAAPAWVMGGRPLRLPVCLIGLEDVEPACA